MTLTFAEIFKKLPPQLQGLILKLEDAPQSPKWHPEGNTLIHTIIVYNRAILDGNHDLAVAAVFHDLGKVDGTHKNNRGEWAAHGHEKESYKICKKYEKVINHLAIDKNKIFEVVKHHMRIKQIRGMRETKRRALQSNPYYDSLLIFSAYDSMSDVTQKEINIAEVTINKIKDYA